MTHHVKVILRIHRLNIYVEPAVTVFQKLSDPAEIIAPTPGAA